MLSVLEVVTTVVVGLMVGVELSVAFVMNPIVNALPEDSRQLAHSRGGRMLGAVMPFWYIGSLVLAAVWAISGRHHHATALVVAAAGLLILSVVMSLLLLVPINNRNTSWTPQNRPEDWKDQLDQWGRWHRVRVAVVVAAFVLLVAALA